MDKMKFSDIFVGKPPIFEETLAPAKTPKANTSVVKTPKESAQKPEKIKKEASASKSKKSDTSITSSGGKKSNTPASASAKKSKAKK